MRVYYPVNEFNELGYSALPLAIFLCDKLVLWSPMSIFIDKVYEDGASILNSDNLIQLIESGNVQIAGREQWFDQKYRKNMPFNKAMYTEFDTKLVQLLHKSTSRELNDRYIIVAPRETGSQWAKEILERDDEKSRGIVEAAKNALNNPSMIPNGVYEKLVRVPQEEQLVFFLQIMRNNITTMDQIQCDNLIYWRDYLNDAFTISNYQVPSKAAYKYPDIEKFVDMCDYLRSIVEIKDYKSFAKMLENKDTKEVRAEITRILDSQLSVGEEYLVWYQEVVNALEKRMHADMKLIFDGCLTTAGIISIIAGLHLNTMDSFQIDVSLHNIFPLIGNMATVIGAGETIHDLKKRLSGSGDSDVVVPTMPFIGGHISDRKKIKKYRDLILQTKQKIYFLR